MIGKKFVRLWPTLSKEKQQWILSNGKEKEHKLIQESKLTTQTKIILTHAASKGVLPARLCDRV